MSIDYLTLACLSDQLDTLLGARVQSIVLPDEWSVGLELYAGRRINLLASAQAQAPRILLTPEKPRRGVEGETPLLLLLRKWLRGARLADVTQPPWERVVSLHWSGWVGECQLVVEIMGRHSNVILVGPDGCVLEAVKHVDSTMSRLRTTLPGRLYQLPPLPPNRRPPTGLAIDDWRHMLTHADPDEPLSAWLVTQLLGAGPMATREIAARATGDPHARVRAATPHAVFRAVEELVAPLNDGWWNPHVALDETGAVIAFTPYEPRQFKTIEPTKDINQAIWRFFEERGLADPYAAARRAVKTVIDRVDTRLNRRLEKIRESAVAGEEIDALRIAGELLLIYQGQVKVGAAEATLTDYAGELRPIALDPALTAVANAQAYFRRYEKARRAAEQIPLLIKRTKLEMAYLEQLEVDLDLAESRPEIDAVHHGLAAAGWSSKRKLSRAQVSGPRRFEVEGFPIYVGRNAHQNERVTFERAGPEDFWLHARGLPGAHVIVKRGKQEVPDEVIQRAAELAAYYSRARPSNREVAVDVTERRFVRRVRGGFPGLVTYRNERTIWARPNKG
jgi:predicted ribosome quality control (RQC) complex YloA/Tae2 family protein